MLQEEYFVEIFHNILIYITFCVWRNLEREYL